MSNCRVCGNYYKEFIDFGMMPIANSFKPKIDIYEEKFKMSVGFCQKCMIVQLLHQPDPTKMFHENYAFFSSTSFLMQNHFKKFANQVIESKKLNDTSLVLEIGCNDGILLQNFKSKNINCIGIEPSKNVATKAEEKGIRVITEFFNPDTVSKIEKEFQKIDAILSANVICHIPDVNSIFSGVKKILKNNGVFIFEEPYLLDIIKKNSFDQIYDEHVFLFSVMSVSFLAKKHDLELFFVEHQETHGGSMRYTIGHKGQNIIDKSVLKQIEIEKNNNLHLESSYFYFENNIKKIRDDLLVLLKNIKSNNKKVVGYAATSKSTTLINYFKITPDLLPVIYDTTPNKHYTFSPGANIPIRPYSEFHESNPDFVLLFAWNHSKEIMHKENEFMKKNRKWITYVPEVKIS